MKYFLILLPFLLIYVFTKPEETIEIKATAPPDKVETLHIDNNRPTPTPTKNTALASWYDKGVCGKRLYGVNCKTANGEIFNEEANTMACDRRFPLGSKFRITYNENTIEAKCTDRGDFAVYGRLFDLSRGAFSKLANLSKGIIKVKWELKSK